MNFVVVRAQNGEGWATVADAEIFHDVFLFHNLTWRWLNWRWWAAALGIFGLCALIASRVLRKRRRRRRLQRRRQIRARLHGGPVREIDLRDPPARPERAALPAGAPACQPDPKVR